MTLYKPTLESVRYVAANMRAADAEEILPLRFDPSPDALAGVIMANSALAWLAAKERPIAVFGAIELRPKAWSAFAFGTDEFPRVAAEMTKFLLREVKPFLFDKCGARRVEAYSHASHVQAHRWLRALGATAAEDRDFGPDGQTYLHFVLRRSDFDVTEQAKPSRIVVTAGGKPDFARPAGS